MTLITDRYINPFRTKRSPLYLKTQDVPRSKHLPLGYKDQSLNDVCSETNRKYINVLCQQNTEFMNIKTGGTYSKP
jgi:hypothetical protein